VWARGLLGAEAAVELLIGHRVWPSRGDFVAVAVEFGRDGITGGAMASVDWQTAVEAVDAGELPCSSSEAWVLRIAASLATHVPVVLGRAVSGLDERNSVAVAEAVLHATGLTGPAVQVTSGSQGWGKR
jgi:hypothetical protein